MAVFCLFSTIALFLDLINLGERPYLIVILNAIACGIVALAYLFVATRYQHYWMIVVSVLQVPYWFAFSYFAYFLGRHFRFQAVPSGQGIRVMAVAALALIMMSYTFFIGFISRQGAEATRIRNELELAHRIQQTLVPAFTLRTGPLRTPLAAKGGCARIVGRKREHQPPKPTGKQSRARITEAISGAVNVFDGNSAKRRSGL